MNKKQARYQITNWPECNQSLIRRGDLDLWFNEKVLTQWNSSPLTGRRGRPRVFSDLAVQCLLALRVFYHLPLRATQGLFLSLLRLLDCPLAVPDYSTLSRRQARLQPGLAVTPSAAPRHLLIDSTGLKIFGEGEWKVRVHGKEKRRTWRKIHLAADAVTREIVATKLTEANIQDCEVPPALLRAVQGEIRKVSSDGASDTWQCRYEIKTRQAEANIPPRDNAAETGARRCRPQ